MKETKAKIFMVSLGVALFFSFIVSATVQLLKDKQEENVRLDRLKHIFSLVENGSIEPKVLLVDIKTGDSKEVTSDVDFFNNFRLLATGEGAVKINKKDDFIGVGSHPRYMPVYLFYDGDKLINAVFFVYGNGLWSTMYGFLSLKGDLRTIQGITFFDQKETPGLGGEVDNPIWKAKWEGKKLFDDDGRFRFSVSKGSDQFSVDGLSGATLTTRGVDNIVKFWFGDNGYKKFLERLKG
ncbi:MAG: NADH:ubiquinone reductase (Na(+)-transporting) subunit C [Calditerrivibrio sp.]|nr:NADH:ubiquinone reductase (Na(+)-transporting) subunit C [Calditerrivibrio sp.]